MFIFCIAVFWAHNFFLLQFLEWPLKKKENLARRHLASLVSGPTTVSLYFYNDDDTGDTLLAAAIPPAAQRQSRSAKLQTGLSRRVKPVVCLALWP